MKWEEKTLNECCISIADGDHQAPPKADKGVPFITISNINADNKIDFSSCMFVTKEYYENLADKRKACKNDVLYSVVGSFGIPVFIDKDEEFVFQRHIAILRPDEKRIYPRFLYYSMKSRDFYNQADSVALGAAQRTISLTALKRMNIFVPPLETQNRIASILSAYDDLIENNQKQIKLLEEAAQRLYKEWFVDLRFPGHEDVKIVDGVPEGWKKKYICDIADTLSGGTPSRSKEDYFKGNIKWIKTKELNDGYVFDTEERITELGFNNSSAKYFPENSIILAMYGATIGKLAISACEMTSNQACCVFNTNKFPEFLEYLFLWLLINRNSLINKGYGSAQQNLSREIINSIQIIVPTDEILLQFSNLSKEIFQKIKILQYANICLKEARDRLLPKLMSGEIEV